MPSPPCWPASLVDLRPSVAYLALPLPRTNVFRRLQSSHQGLDDPGENRQEGTRLAHPLEAPVDLCPDRGVSVKGLSQKGRNYILPLVDVVLACHRPFADDRNSTDRARTPCASWSLRNSGEAGASDYAVIAMASKSRAETLLDHILIYLSSVF